MPRTTQQMRVLSPVLSDAPGSREINGIPGVREDGTFARDNERTEWVDAQKLDAARERVANLRAEVRKELRTSPAKVEQQPLGLRLAQKVHDTFVAESSAKDAFGSTEVAMQKDDNLSRRTTTTFGEALEEPKDGLFKRLFRRGNQQGQHKK